MDSSSAQLQGVDEKRLLQELWARVKGSNELKPFSEVIDDRFLLHFLRGKKFDVPKAFTTVKNYFSTRQKYAKKFRELDPQKCRVLESGAVRVLKERDAEGRPAIVLDPAFWDPRELSLEDMILAFIMITEELWHIKEFEIEGYSFILNISNVSLSHIPLFTPSHVIQGVNLLWNSSPVRFKGIYFIDANWMLSTILKMMCPFLPQKLKDRFHVWKPHEYKLHEIFDHSKLPHSLRRIQDNVAADGDWNANDENVEDNDDIYWDNEVICRVRNNGDFYRRIAQMRRACSNDTQADL